MADVRDGSRDHGRCTGSGSVGSTMDERKSRFCSTLCPLKQWDPCTVFLHIQTLTRGLDLAFRDPIVRQDLPMGGGATLLSVVAESANWKVILEARGTALPLTSWTQCTCSTQLASHRLSLLGTEQLNKAMSLISGKEVRSDMGWKISDKEAGLYKAYCC
jgi:hypothetical protein